MIRDIVDPSRYIKQKQDARETPGVSSCEFYETRIFPYFQHSYGII